MKICCGMGTALLMTLGMVAGPVALAQPEKKPAAQPDKKPAAQPAGDASAQPQLPPGWTEADMKACMDACTPGPMHAYLAKGAGVWTGKTTMWMAPKTEPMKSECTSTVTTMMDGKYVKCEMAGEMPGMGPFNGFGISGFDNVSQKFQSTWIDNMGTGIMYSTGQCDSTGKVFTFSGEADDFDTGKKVKERSVTTVAGADSWKMEMFRPGPDGKEYKTMEINYHRLGTAAGGGLKRSGQAPASGKKDPVKDTDKPATPQPTAPK